MSTSAGPPELSKTLTPTATVGSHGHGHTHTSSNSASGRGGGYVRRRRAKVTNEKKIADDEFMAAAIGDVEWLKQSLRENGSQINFDKNGLTALHLAAIHGRLECLKLCIEKFKYSVNLASSTGWRPVHFAVSNQTGKRSLQCLSYLLEKGADPSIMNDDGITPVHQAASEGHVQCLKLLIEVGAKIDGKDCRGNTPLDLAKLWAHRKCARLLATEMWHRDKNNVAKEMQQLKTFKMQQVLRELEEEEDAKLEQQFYGQAAYEQWLSSRNLNPKHTGQDLNFDKQKNGLEDNVGSVREKRVESLSKPNSVAKHRSEGADTSAEKGALTMSIFIEQKSAGSKGRRKETVSSTLAETTDFLAADDRKVNNEENQMGKESKTNVVNHSSNWNFSPFIPKKEYLPILQDEYPRNEYTMMPVREGCNKYYDGKFAKSDDEGVDPGKLKKKKLRRPRLSKDVIDRALSADPTLFDRPIIFKAKHIDDVHKKHKYSEDQKPASEVPLHLCNDISSQLVKMNIRFPLDSRKDCLILHSRSKASSATTSNKKTSGTPNWEWSKDVPVPSLLITLKQMSKPNHFPSLPGESSAVS